MLHPDNLREAREARRLSLSRLAREAGVPRYYLTGIESWPEHSKAVEAALEAIPVEWQRVTPDPDTATEPELTNA